MSTLKQVLMGAVLLALVSCSQKDEFTNRLGGKAGLENISSAQKISAWRTAGSEDNYDGYFTKTGMPIVVSSELAGQLKKTLLDRDSYQISRFTQKACTLLPGVVVDFISQNGTNDVFFCFECAALVVKPDGKPPLQSIDFDPSYAEFVRIMKLIFPADKQIQTLKE